MRFILLLLLVVNISWVEATTIYKWLDEKGNVVYSDQPHAGAQVVDISQSGVGKEEKAALGGKIGYKRFEIVAPKSDEQIKVQGNGAVDIQIAIDPDLDQGAGHGFTFSLDGRIIAEHLTLKNFSVSNLTTGEHTLNVNLVNKENVVMDSAKTVRFFVTQDK